MPSRGSFDIIAVHSTTVSPLLIRTAPLACSATVPVVIVTGLPATSNVFVTSATCQYSSTGRPGTQKLSSKRARLEARFQAPGPPKQTGRGGPARTHLSPETQLRDQRSVAPHVGAVQVVQQSATLADQQQQTAARVVVLLVGPEVLRELRDALGEDGNLDLW